jgi:WD40 repeat protein
MSQAPLTHPTPEQLSAYKLNRLSAGDVVHLEAHLADCLTCCQSLDTLPDDTVADLLRPPGARPTSLPVTEGTLSPSARVSDAALSAAWADHPRYRVLQRLGAGGMGTVFKAEHRIMERPVALKVLSPDLTNRVDLVERFRREARAAARLDHPNIVRAFDAEQAGEFHFLAMEFVDGISLAQLLEQRGPLPVAQACEYVRQAALGLQHAHERGMVHRDIKPHNLMLTPDGVIKVLDFGLARFVRETAAAEMAPDDPTQKAGLAAAAGDLATPGGISHTGLIMGTTDYIAPEQATDAHAADIRADLYSLGCTLYQLLSGRVPFPDRALLDRLLAHIEQTPTPLAQLRPDVPPKLARIVERLMAKKPEGRYQTPAEVAQALEPFTAVGAARRRRRRRLLAAAALLFLAAALGWVGFAVYRSATDKGTLVVETDDPGIQVIVKRAGKDVTIIDPKTKGEVRLASGAYEVELAGDGQGLKLSADQFTLTRGGQQVVKVQRLPADTRTETQLFPGHAEEVGSVTFCAVGCHALSASADGTARLWEIASGREVRRFVGHTDAVRSAAYSPKGGQVLTGGKDGSVCLWDIQSGNRVRPFLGHAGEVRSVAFAPDGRFVLSGGLDSTLRLWDVESGKEVRRFEGHTEGVECVGFSPEGSRIVSSGRDGTVRLWDRDSRREIRRFEGHAGAVLSVAFSADGRRLVSGGQDGTVRVWDAESGTELRRFAGSTAPVAGVAFCRDDRRILAGCLDNTAFVLDAKTGREVRRLKGHTDAVLCVAVSPDGSQGLTGSRDHTLRRWQLPILDVRNPFGVPDVPDPDGDDVRAFAKQTHLDGGPTDANAAAWPATATTGQHDSLDGVWCSRWTGGGAGEKPVEGTALLRTAGDRVYILLNDAPQSYLLEARRDKNRLAGRHITVGDGVVRDSGPWVGLIVDAERIDGAWRQGRWDLRRKLK